MFEAGWFSGFGAGARSETGAAGRERKNTGESQ